jgi:flagellar M-ring protein FliF
VDKFLKQIEALARGLSARQKLLLGVSAALVFGVLGLFIKLTEKADFKTLYSGLSPQDAQAVVQRLTAKNISYELSTDGTSVSVPADQLDRTRLDLASEGMPQTGRLGFELFDKPNWAGSDFSEQVNYQRALEGELERTIETLGNVESVRVHIVLPHESLFTDRERVAKAAVVMKLRGGGLTDDQVTAVTHLVASAVDNLSPGNVTLIGADGRTPLVARGHEGLKGQDASVELETALAEKLVSTLAPVVGSDHVKASVTVAYDQSSGDTTQETYDPNNPVLVSSQVQEERFGGSPPAGIPGTPSNVPSASVNNAANPGGVNQQQGNQPPAAATNQNIAGQAANGKPSVAPPNALNPIASVSSESEGQRSEAKSFAVSKTLRHTIEPPGRIQKVAAAVLVDDVVEQQKDAKGKATEVRRKRTPEEMKQIEDLAKAAIGFDATRGDVLSVQDISFIVPSVEPPVAAPPVERVRILVEKWIWLARYGVLLLLFAIVYLLVLRPVTNQLLTAFRSHAPGTVGAPALASTAAAGGGGAASLSSEPANALSEAEFERELNQTNSDIQRVVRMKRHLSDRVKREPVAASQLIRHWINEERGR